MQASPFEGCSRFGSYAVILYRYVRDLLWP